MKKIQGGSTSPKRCNKWTQEDEDKLVSLSDDIPIHIDETEYGKETAKRRTIQKQDLINYAKEICEEGGNPEDLLDTVRSAIEGLTGSGGATGLTGSTGSVGAMGPEGGEIQGQTNSQATVFTDPWGVDD